MSQVIMSNRWWKQAILRGHEHFNRQDYDKASVEYYRALIHSESLYKLRGTKAFRLQFDVPFHCMYVIACYNLADTFHCKNEPDLVQHYLESAFCHMNYEMRRFRYCQKHQQCVSHHYYHALNTLTHYLKQQGYSNEKIGDNLGKLSAQMVTPSVDNLARDAH